MDFFDTINNRHSVRRYRKNEIEEEKLTRILNAIDIAPSAGDLQAYEVVVVRDQGTKAALVEAAYGQQYLAEVPVVLVFCSDVLLSASKYAKRGADLYTIQDATIAATYCQLAATAEGLATVWVGAFDPDKVAAAVQCPDKVIPVAIIPVGYPDEQPERTPRRALSDLIRMERF